VTGDESLKAERDLYRRLLDLGTAEDEETFLREALGLVLHVSAARRGYIELLDDGEVAAAIAEAFTEDDLQNVRAALSRGVIAQALATGHTIVSASALDDPRFSTLESVKANRIEAVLCAPIGTDPPIGVVYLQDRIDPGPFSEDDRRRAELFARHLAPFADRLVLRRRARGADPTRPMREALDLGSLAGRSESIARVLREVAAVARSKVTVLLTGPSGTGKTRIARVIHQNSPRRDAPFVEVNCATLPEALVESELFGAMPGAHSTATRKIPGKVEAAEGGTLFLDDVAELPLAAQAKLLQLLQSLEYFPLGATKPVHADVRIIAATNVDLRAAVDDRTFREDLLYRLQIVPIRVPPLSERRDDVHELVQSFVARSCEVHGFASLGISPGAFRAAENADWPGNVRQLENALEAAVLRASSEGASAIEIAHLFPEEAAPDSNEAVTFQAATRKFQGQFVRRTLDETGWNVIEAAKRLDIARSHVYNLIRAHGLERDSKKGT
jgi:Nif-specific regulatory protein